MGLGHVDRSGVDEMLEIAFRGQCAARKEECAADISDSPLATRSICKRQIKITYSNLYNASR